MRRVYILEKAEGKWSLTCPNSSRITRFAMGLPIKWVRVESARIGNDLNYSKISFGHQLG